MSAARTERLLNLLTLLLNSRRAISLREIRELDEFGAYDTEDPKSGERAFERDKAALLELGVPLRWVAAPQQDDEDDGAGGYVIDQERYFLPELQLTPGDLALLSIAGAAAASLEGFPDKAAVVRALAKLGFDVEEAGRAPTLAHAPLLAGVDAQRLGNSLKILHDAVARQQRVEMTYLSQTEGPTVQTQRQVEPYGLFYRQGVWYLVGFCRLRRAERTFNLGRVEGVRTLGKPEAFAVPPDFDLKVYIDRRSWEFPQHAPTAVTIRLAPRLRSAIPEIFGSRLHLEESSSGPIVTVQVTHLAALLETVLPYGAAAEILAPHELRQQMKALYESLAAHYANRPDVIS